MQNLGNIVSIIKDSEKTLFILCGFPYAGKSYIAKQLQTQTDIAFVSIDDIFHTHGFNWDSNILPDADNWEKIFNESYEKTRRALLDGNNVLYDSTNQTVASRDRLREVTQSVGAETKVIYIQSSVETVWKRWEDNQKNPSRSVVSRELVQQTIDMFEEPTEIENVIVIDN
ncbi:ATP-binding protein [Patescibacteria group bacterium]|nr:ATP-binding protein [Patescibacteria group bacterium]